MELLRVTPAFEGHEVVYVTVNDVYRTDVGDARFHVVNDATRWSKVGLIKQALRLLWIMVKERPDVVISTGASAGFFAIRIGRLFGAKSIWLDSIANAAKLSDSGRHIGKHADLWLTQWKHLEREGGPSYRGAVL